MESIDYKKKIEEIEKLVSVEGDKSAKLRVVIQLITKRGNKRAAAIYLINSNLTAINTLGVAETSALINNLEKKKTKLQGLDKDIMDKFLEAKEFTYEGLEILASKNDKDNLKILTFCNKNFNLD